MKIQLLNTDKAVTINFHINIDLQAEVAESRKKRTFRKFTYRGVDLDQLLDMNK